jgi:fructose-specific phosphotransferase system component IIB
MSSFIEIIEPSKRKGRPKQVLTPEQIQAKKDKIKARTKELKKEKFVEHLEVVKPLKKRGVKAKSYTEEEILAKIDHTKNYQKKKYVSRKQESKGLNHCLAKKYKLKKDDI